MSGVRPGGPLPYSPALDRLAREVLGIINASEVWIALARLGSTGGELGLAAAVLRRAGGPQMMNVMEAPPLARAAISLAARDKYAIHSPDVLHDPRFASVQTLPYGSIFCAQVYDNERVVGALLVARATVGAFTDYQRQLVSLYASQIATTLQLIDAAALSEAQARELAAQLDATRALTSSRDSRGVVNAITSSIRRVIACDAALIYRFEERGALLRVVAGLGAESERLVDSTISVQDKRSLAAQVASARAPRYNVMLRSDDQMGALTGALATDGPVALICEPLMAQERLLGVVMLARVLPFEEAEQQAIGRFSAIAAAALERVGLFEEMRAQRDQRLAMFASASDGMALFGGDSRVIEVNPAFADYLECGPGALQGKICWQALNGSPGSPPGLEQCLLCHGACRVNACVESGLASAAPIECEFPVARAVALSEPVGSGGPRLSGRVVSFTLTPIMGPAGYQALLVGRDISEARKLELSRMDFLESVMHEIRQPLQNMLSSQEMLLQPAAVAPDARRHVAGALSGTLSVRALVDDLYVLTQRNFGHFKVAPVPDDLSAVAQAVASEFSALASGSHVKLEVSVHDGLPPALIDRRRAAQVARNLLGNALKFTRAGGWIRMTTRVEDRKGRRWAVLEVADSGAGISDESQKHIFQRGYQAPTPGQDGRPQGSGLGLAIVRYIMEEHHGHIVVSSKLGQGSRFTAYFPLAGGATRP